MTFAVYDARQLAIGWLSVALASGTDPDTPALNRTISIEHYAQGVRLAATDRFLLLHSFVPNLDHKPDDEPPLEIGPDRIAVARDINGRAKSLLAYLHGLACAIDKGETGEPLPEVTLALDVVEEDVDEPMFAGLEARYVVIDFPGHERVRLDTYDGTYPSWRGVTTGFKPVTTKAIALNPDFIARLGKLGKLHDGRPLLWHFGGADKAALIEVADANPSTRGVVMPVRWDFDAQPGEGR